MPLFEMTLVHRGSPFFETYTTTGTSISPGRLNVGELMYGSALIILRYDFRGTVWIDSASAEGLQGRARFTWGRGAEPDVSVEIAFHATLYRGHEPYEQMCSADRAQASAARQSELSSAAVQAATTEQPKPAEPAAPYVVTPTSYTPSHPFGLESLLEDIEHLPAAEQAKIRQGYDFALSGGTMGSFLAMHYDAGCVARAIWQVRRKMPQEELQILIQAAPIHGCIDRAKLLVLYTPGTVMPNGEKVWPQASDEQRARFETCAGERIANAFIEVYGKERELQVPNPLGSPRNQFGTRRAQIDMDCKNEIIG
jgi:hypothetical protein